MNWWKCPLVENQNPFLASINGFCGFFDLIAGRSFQNLDGPCQNLKRPCRVYTDHPRLHTWFRHGPILPNMALYYIQLPLSFCWCKDKNFVSTVRRETDLRRWVAFDIHIMDDPSRHEQLLYIEILLIQPNIINDIEILFSEFRPGRERSANTIRNMKARITVWTDGTDHCAQGSCQTFKKKTVSWWQLNCRKHTMQPKHNTQLTATLFIHVYSHKLGHKRLTHQHHKMTMSNCLDKFVFFCFNKSSYNQKNIL